MDLTDHTEDQESDIACHHQAHTDHMDLTACLDITAIDNLVTVEEADLILLIH